MGKTYRSNDDNKRQSPTAEAMRKRYSNTECTMRDRRERRQKDRRQRDKEFQRDEW